MQAHIHPWETALLSLAHEAGIATTHHSASPLSRAFDDELLSAAYAYCETLTTQHSRSFHLASALLPGEKRRAVRALYAFCRVTDDIVDRSLEVATLAGAAAGEVQQAQPRQEQLEHWRRRAISLNPPVDDLVAVAWADARQRFHVPWRYAEQLIDGVGRDLQQSRYNTFEELAEYSYGVASTVGLMSMHIVGYSGAEAIPYAIKLGVALQMTNILRDIADDWSKDRVYLPQEELREFGLNEQAIAQAIDSGRVDDRWRRFLRFQIERNRRLYQEAEPGLAMLSLNGRLSIVAAADLYRGILDDIEAHDYNVFTRRAHVTAWGKLRRLPRIWWRSRRM